MRQSIRQPSIQHVKTALMNAATAKFLFSTAIAVVMLLSVLSVLPDDIFAGSDKTYLRAPAINDFFITVLTFFVCYAMLTGLQSSYGCRRSAPAKALTAKQGIGIFLTLCICWLPYWLTYFPGGLYSDTIQCFRMAMGERALTNHHPILYTGIIKICLMIAQGNPQGATFWLTLLQYCFCAGVLTYVVLWLSQKGIGRIGTVLTFVFFAIFPFFPLYAVYNWKDTLFSMCLVMFTLTVFNIVLSKADIAQNAKSLAAYCVWGLLVCFLRNNGVFIVLLTTIILIIVFRKIIIQHAKPFVMGVTAMLVLVIVVQGPIFSSMGLKVDTAVESFGIPIQQTAAVIVKNQITKENSAYYKQILSIKHWREYYAPLVVDSLKWEAPDFNSRQIESHPGEFLFRWTMLLPTHLPTMVEAYLMATNSYWNLFQTMGICNIETGIWFKEIGVTNTNLLKRATTIDLTGIVEEIPALPEGICLFALLSGVILLVITGKSSDALGYTPIIIAVATVLVATPIASSLRYVFYLVPMLPVYFLAPLFRES